MNECNFVRLWAHLKSKVGQTKKIAKCSIEIYISQLNLNVESRNSFSLPLSMRTYTSRAMYFFYRFLQFGCVCPDSIFAMCLFRFGYEILCDDDFHCWAFSNTHKYMAPIHCCLFWRSFSFFLSFGSFLQSPIYLSNINFMINIFDHYVYDFYWGGSYTDGKFKQPYIYTDIVRVKMFIYSYLLVEVERCLYSPLESNVDR